MLAETPENAGYMVAAYVVTPVILVGYLALLWRRMGGKTEGRKDGETG
ncbi:MAG: hypothetical protein H0T86_15145 [Gemmatimonadales bacterium]|nr:hypothetical protein [Gemmatimonadales bacterium]